MSGVEIQCAGLGEVTWVGMNGIILQGLCYFC